MIEIRRKMDGSALRRKERLSEMLFEGEANAHKFIIEPDGVSFSGYSVTARFKPDDGQEVELIGTNTGNAEVVLTAACYVPGRFSLFIYVVNASETVCVYTCEGHVCPTRGASGESGTPVAVQSYDLSEWCAQVEQRLHALEGEEMQ